MGLMFRLFLSINHNGINVSIPSVQFSVSLKKIVTLLSGGKIVYRVNCDVNLIYSYEHNNM